MNAEFYDPISASVRLRRSDIFGLNDTQLPISALKDAGIPQIGFVGTDYRSGGTMLLGINPGGGGDKYVRTREDSYLLPLIESFRAGEASPAALQTIFDQCAANMRTWNLWRIVQPVIEACGNGQTEIAYLNWCPLRTRGDNMPQAHVMRRSYDVHLESGLTTNR